MKAIARHKLTNIPLDRWDSGKHKHIHHTGFIVRLENSTWHDEWEGEEYEDAENCVFTEGN